MPTIMHVENGDLAIAQIEMKPIVEVAERVRRTTCANELQNPRFILKRGLGNAWQYAATTKAMRALRWAVVANAAGFRAGVRKRQDAT